MDASVHPLRPVTRFGIVAAGFGIAFGGAWLAVMLWQWATDGPAAQASSGMYAFGDLVLGVAVFAALGIVPFCVGLFWLRSAPRVWPIVAWCAVLYAFTGLLAVAVSGWARSSPASVALLSDARIGTMVLSAPLVFFTGLFAPTARSRWMLIGSALFDGAVFACVVIVHFVVPQFSR